jgi:uncharacterized protein (TIGR00255 family)
MESMTGFGTASARIGGFLVTASTRSVNLRGLGIHLRFPRELQEMEAEAYELARDLFLRGRIEVALSVDPEGPAGSVPEPDRTAAESYLKAALEMSARLDIPSGFTVKDILGLPGVLRVPDPSRCGELRNTARDTVLRALEGLREARLREGAALEVFFREGLKALAAGVEPIGAAHGDRVRAVYEKTRKRVEELLGESETDPARFVQEIAVMADRLDISEECQRLLHHVREAGSVLGDRACGMKLGFLVQEMHRELNTMGAKVADSEAVHGVIRLKEIVGGMKEQSANVQ